MNLIELEDGIAQYPGRRRSISGGRSLHLFSLSQILATTIYIIVALLRSDYVRNHNARNRIIQDSSSNPARRYALLPPILLFTGRAVVGRRHWNVSISGMNVASGPELAAAVTNYGGLGVIGGHGYTPKVLRQQVRPTPYDCFTKSLHRTGAGKLIISL